MYIDDSLSVMHNVLGVMRCMFIHTAYPYLHIPQYLFDKHFNI